jgi:hypothetical protein
VEIVVNIDDVVAVVVDVVVIWRIVIFILHSNELS